MALFLYLWLSLFYTQNAYNLGPEYNTALHVADPGSIPGITHGSLSIAKSKT